MPDVTVYNIFSKSSFTEAQIQLRCYESKAGFRTMEKVLMDALSHQHEYKVFYGVSFETFLCLF